jgi:hypothetical protein
LADFRRAIKYPAMTASFCFRAIDTMRASYFEDLNTQNGRKRRIDSWEKLRRELSIERNKIQKMEDFAVPNRHGTYPEIHYADREEIMNVTRTIINAMVAKAISQIPDFPEIIIDDSSSPTL